MDNVTSDETKVAYLAKRLKDTIVYFVENGRPENPGCGWMDDTNPEKYMGFERFFKKESDHFTVFGPNRMAAIDMFLDMFETYLNTRESAPFDYDAASKILFEAFVEEYIPPFENRSSGQMIGVGYLDH